MPIYVSISGIVFDVSSREDLYGKNGIYNVVAGKEVSESIVNSPLNPLRLKKKKKPVDESEIEITVIIHFYFLVIFKRLLF